MDDFYPKQRVDHTPYGWLLVLIPGWFVILIALSLWLIRTGDSLQQRARQHPLPGLESIRATLPTGNLTIPTALPTLPSARELVQQEVSRQIDAEKSRLPLSPTPLPSSSPTVTDLTDVQRRLQDLDGSAQ